MSIISNLKKIPKCQLILHLAGQSSGEKSKAQSLAKQKDDPNDYYRRKLLRARMVVAEGASGTKVPQKADDSQIINDV